MAKEIEWTVSGDCTEVCTLPPVCPYYWGSSTPKGLHNSKNQCEGAFTFHIKQGNHNKVNLDGLNAGFCFNSPVGGMTAREPWTSVLYIDSHAYAEQAAALVLSIHTMIMMNMWAFWEATRKTRTICAGKSSSGCAMKSIYLPKAAPYLFPGDYFIARYTSGGWTGLCSISARHHR